jgi:hypothetical protein
MDAQHPASGADAAHLSGQHEETEPAAMDDVIMVKVASL